MTFSTQDVIGVCRQKNANALSYSTPKSFEATGAGTASTIVSTTLGSYGSGNDDFVGMIVECVGPVTSANVGRRATVLSYSHVATTLTIEQLDAATADGDQFELIDPPHWWLAEETGGSATDIVDTSRGEADDVLNGTAERGGPNIIVVEADNIADTVVRRVSDWVNATGTLTAASTMSANTAIGDLFEVWEFPNIVAGSFPDCEQPDIIPDTVTGTRGEQPSVAGLRESGGAATDYLFRGPGSDRIGDEAELHTPLASVLDATAVGDVTVDAASSTSSVTYDAGSADVNDIRITEAGDVFVVTADSGTALTPSPTLRTAPAEDTTCYGGQRYVPTDAINYAIALMRWHGKEVLDMFWGCAPQTISIAAQRGDFMRVSINWLPADWKRTHRGAAAYSRAWRSLLPSVAAQKLGAMRVNVGGTELEALGFTLEINLGTEQLQNGAAPNHANGPALGGVDSVSGTISCYLDTDTKAQLDPFLTRKQQTILIQSGKGYGAPGVLGWWGYKTQYTGFPITDEGGRKVVSLPFRVTEDRTELNLSRWMLGIF